MSQNILDDQLQFHHTQIWPEIIVILFRETFESS